MSLVCERCSRATAGVSMSYFDASLICSDCWSAETRHPEFARAKQAEQDAVDRGDVNFPGIGLPDGLV